MSKALPRTSRLLVVLAVGMGACGGGGKGSGNYPDASTFGGGTGTNGGASGATGGKTGSGTGNTVGASGGSMAATGGKGGTGLPGSGGTGTPAGGASGTPPAAGSALLLQANAILMGPGLVCSSAPAATTPAPDQWCGIFAPSGNNNLGLIVFNLTKALAGTAVCTGTGDPNCLALTSTIDTTDNNAVYSFYGQTLIYSDTASIYAWRPGWTAGRALIAHSTATSAHCEGEPDDVATAICVTAANGIYAGSVATQTGGTLPLVETAASQPVVGFSPDGLSVLWSAMSTTNSPAGTLKMQTIGDATTKKTIAANVSDWTVSPDATRWYWLSNPTTTNMVTTGTLQTAPYPAGTAPAAIQSKVGQYLPFGAKSVLTFTTAATGNAADMNVVADVDAPTTSTTVVEATDVLGALDVTNTGTILYATMIDQPDPNSNNVLVDLRVINTDGTGKCAVAATAVADTSASFTPGGAAVEWVQVTLDSAAKATAIAGQVTPLAECAPHVFSTGLLYTFFDVTSGFVVQQNYDSSAYTADFGYAALGATGVPSAETVVQKNADQTIWPVFPPGRVLFTLNTGASYDGVYASPVVGGTPLTAATPRPLARAALSRQLASTPRLAQARLAGHAIPSLIAAPLPPARPLSTTALNRFAPARQLRGNLLHPLARATAR